MASPWSGVPKNGLRARSLAQVFYSISLPIMQSLQVRWQGSDIEGWPILVIKIAKACAKCQGDDAESVAEAVISQVDT